MGYIFQQHISLFVFIIILLQFCIVSGSHNGMELIVTDCDDFSSQTLEPGKEYYIIVKLTLRDCVISNQEVNATLSIFGTKKQRITIQESVFHTEVRMLGYYSINFKNTVFEEKLVIRGADTDIQLNNTHVRKCGYIQNVPKIQIFNGSMISCDFDVEELEFFVADKIEIHNSSLYHVDVRAEDTAFIRGNVLLHNASLATDHITQTGQLVIEDEMRFTTISGDIASIDVRNASAVISVGQTCIHNARVSDSKLLMYADSVSGSFYNSLVRIVVESIVNSTFQDVYCHSKSCIEAKILVKNITMDNVKQDPENIMFGACFLDLMMFGSIEEIKVSRLRQMMLFNLHSGGNVTNVSIDDSMFTALFVLQYLPMSFKLDSIAIRNSTVLAPLFFFQGHVHNLVISNLYVDEETVLNGAVLYFANELAITKPIMKNAIIRSKSMLTLFEAERATLTVESSHIDTNGSHVILSEKGKLVFAASNARISFAVDFLGHGRVECKGDETFIAEYKDVYKLNTNCFVTYTSDYVCNREGTDGDECWVMPLDLPDALISDEPFTLIDPLHLDGTRALRFITFYNGPTLKHRFGIGKVFLAIKSYVEFMVSRDKKIELAAKCPYFYSNIHGSAPCMRCTGDQQFHSKGNKLFSCVTTNTIFDNDLIQYDSGYLLENKGDMTALCTYGELCSGKTLSGLQGESDAIIKYFFPDFDSVKPLKFTNKFGVEVEIKTPNGCYAERYDYQCGKCFEFSPRNPDRRLVPAMYTPKCTECPSNSVLGVWMMIYMVLIFLIVKWFSKGNTLPWTRILRIKDEEVLDYDVFQNLIVLMKTLNNMLPAFIIIISFLPSSVNFPSLTSILKCYTASGTVKIAATATPSNHLHIVALQYPSFLDIYVLTVACYMIVWLFMFEHPLRVFLRHLVSLIVHVSYVVCLAVSFSYMLNNQAVFFAELTSLFSMEIGVRWLIGAQVGYFIMMIILHGKAVRANVGFFWRFIVYNYYFLFIPLIAAREAKKVLERSINLKKVYMGIIIVIYPQIATSVIQFLLDVTFFITPKEIPSAILLFVILFYVMGMLVLYVPFSAGFFKDQYFKEGYSLGYRKGHLYIDILWTVLRVLMDFCSRLFFLEGMSFMGIYILCYGVYIYFMRPFILKFNNVVSLIFVFIYLLLQFLVSIIPLLSSAKFTSFILTTVIIGLFTAYIVHRKLKKVDYKEITYGAPLLNVFNQ
ncbi:hypothetical protein PCE1_001675 [Barthelona sp. PCE]